jgi:predicted carbohydrate-binding protein with CBM5 and CBM33 domain
MRAKKLIAVAGAAVLGVVTFVAVSNRSPVEAHGGLTFPSTRTHACYVDGRRSGGGGDLQPSNPACVAAIAQGGKQPLWDWFGNLISNAGGRHREIIPDGKLCGPTPKYDAYNLARADWPVTNVQPGATVTIRYNAWAPHPGTWTQYITRDGFDVTQPLKWSDLDPEPFDVVTNPPINGQGPEGAEYTWRARLPNKTGRHIIYSIWQRSDSPEAFYNCSDVMFGGTSTPTSSTDTRPTSTSPTTAVTVPTTAPTSTTTTVPGPVGNGGCEATAKVESSWSAGFQATVVVRNTGTAPLSGWRVGLGFPSGATVAQGWNGTFSGTSVTPAAWNGALAPGQSTTFGFLGQGPADPPPVVTGCTSP